MPSFKAIITSLVLLLPIGSLAQVRAEVRFNYKRGSYKGCYYDVIVTKNGKQDNITWFRPWEEIDKVLLSPDDRYLMVRHKPQSGKSYLLSIYDIQTFRLLKRMAPGFGGDFEWNNRHQVIHQWGCGMNCSNFRLYDLHMNVLFFTLSSGGFLLSPGKDFLIQYSMHRDRMWVYNLKQIKRSLKPLVYKYDIDSSYNADQVQFVAGNQVELIPNNTGLPNKYIDLDKVTWKRIATKNIGE